MGTRAKVTLRKGVEMAKALEEETAFTNELIKTAQGLPEQVNYNNKVKKQPSQLPTQLVFGYARCIVSHVNSSSFRTGL